MLDFIDTMIKRILILIFSVQAESSVEDITSCLYKTSQSDVVVTNDYCIVPGLFGTFPRQIGASIQRFANISHDPKNWSILRNVNDNRLIFFYIS